MKRVTKKKKRKTEKIGLKYKLIIGTVAFAMFLCVITVFYNILGNYRGLGFRHHVDKSPYDMSCFYNENGLRYYEDKNYESVAGIDVSTYQKKVNWKKVKTSGIDFAMIRLGFRASSNGRLYLDDRYKENVRGAKAAGLDVGVYFFSQATDTKEAIREARFVVRHIRGKGINYPVAFDMEPVEGADRINRLSIKKRTEIADAFCQVIERNGYKAMIYGNPGWLNNKLDLSYLSDYDIWMAHYSKRTDFQKKYKIWQYSNRGKVKGISGKVDLNILFVKKRGK